MNIYISADLEGIHGVDRYDLHKKNDPEYKEWKTHVGKLMSDEILAIHDGMLQKGYKNIIVFDSHGSGNTLTLPNNITSLKQVYRTENDNTLLPAFSSQINGIILWGYHVKAGSDMGKLKHTTSRRIKSIFINNKEVGESYLYGLYAHHFNIPILAISGDKALNSEIKNDIGDIPFFNSETGNNSDRNSYLQSITDFIFNLSMEDIQNKNKLINWPIDTEMIVCYKQIWVNLARWILRKQFRYSELKSLSCTTYSKSTFYNQFNNFNGYPNKQ